VNLKAVRLSIKESIPEAKPGIKRNWMKCELLKNSHPKGKGLSARKKIYLKWSGCRKKDFKPAVLVDVLVYIITKNLT